MYHNRVPRETRHHRQHRRILSITSHEFSATEVIHDADAD